MFIKIGVLEQFAIFTGVQHGDFLKMFAIYTGKHLCWSFFLKKLHAFWPTTLLKKHLWLLLPGLIKFSQGQMHSLESSTITLANGQCIFEVEVQGYRNWNFTEKITSTQNAISIFSAISNTWNNTEAKLKDPPKHLW